MQKKKNAKMRKMYVRSAHRHQSAEHEQEVHSILTLLDCHLQLYLSGGMEIVFTSGPFLIKVVFFYPEAIGPFNLSHAVLFCILTKYLSV